MLVVLAASVVVSAAGCPSSKEIRVAQSSAYDADFAIVYSEALAAVREVYPEVDDNPVTGAIKTAWYPVQYATTGGDPSQHDPNDPSGMGQATDPTQQANGSQNPQNFTTPSSEAYKRQFVRFDVVVTGGRPWHIRISGVASEWDPQNAEPTTLKGPAIPHWLPGRRDALTIAIYRRLRKYAVHFDEPKEAPDAPPPPEVDPKTFGTIPADAVKVATSIVQAVETRNTKALRALLAPDVVYSMGAAGDADTAFALWQADPETFATLAKILRAGCRTDGDGVTCPPEATTSPGYLGWRATLEPRAGTWQLTKFFQGD